MKLLIHSPTSTVTPMEFENRSGISYHTFWAFEYLPMLGLRWDRLCTISKFLSYMRKEFNYQYYVSLEEWYKLWVHFYVSYEKFSTKRVNSLLPSDTIWRYRSMSTLAQVMACCLTAPSHYLSQCWLMISEVLWYSPDSNFTENT